MPTSLSEIKIDTRPEKHTMGIRIQTQFKGMFAEVDKLRKELNLWMKEQDSSIFGHMFLRYHVIDMEEEMDIEFGVLVDEPLPETDRIKAEVLPAGRYASLIYQGNGYTGNKTLVEWAKANAIQWDRWEDPKGDGFRCRTEIYLTDPKTEHRKTKWDIEVAIKLKDE